MSEPTADATLKMIGVKSAVLLTPQPWIHYAFLALAALVLVFIAGAIVYMLFKKSVQDKFVSFLFEVGADGKPGKASVSRLQMLIWNFVVAFAFLYVLGTRENILSASKALFQPEILILLGISNVTYFLGKHTKQGSAVSQAGPSENTTDRGGQPMAPGEQPVTSPGPQGTQ